MARARRTGAGPPTPVLVIDIGGSHIKIRASGRSERRITDSGPNLTPSEAVAAVHDLAGDWKYRAISIGYPGPVRHNRPARDPRNLGPGWRDFDFAKAFGLPVRVVNDALLQAIGSYEGGRMLFLGLGTGLGSALVLDNLAHPLELAHLPYREGRSFEDYVGARGLKRLGRKKWEKRVRDVIKCLRDALQVEYVVVGGGNVRKLEKLPKGARRGKNANAFLGGFRLWEPGGVRI